MVVPSALAIDWVVNKCRWVAVGTAVTCRPYRDLPVLGCHSGFRDDIGLPTVRASELDADLKRVAP